MPLSFIYVLFLLGLGIFLVVMVQVGAISIAFEKLGLSPSGGVVLLLGSLLGSGINIPLYLHERKSNVSHVDQPLPILPWGLPRRLFPGKTLVAVNVGGCLIPGGLSLYLLSAQSLNPVAVVLSLVAVTAVCYLLSRPIPGIGFGMPMFVAPLFAALIAILLEPANSAPLAYIGGTLGVIIGADLLHLRDLDRIEAQVASIGGAGTFDGIFFTGIIAALLA
ncbi:MAG: DUF1614 domain-containing protein [Gammaproteobacteria bacterium]|nr:DUF1614 domain-containing protein [Gammaproteobacteria bacterium]